MDRFFFNVMEGINALPWIPEPLSNLVQTISSPSSSVPNAASNCGLALSAVETVS